MGEVPDSTDLILRPARPDEHAALSNLCMRSKATWGYDDAFMEMCRDELTLSEADCVSPNIIVAERDGKLVGMAEISADDEGCFLEKLFVDPDQQNGGIGRMLLDWAVIRASTLGQREMIIEADPGAEGFYERCGAVRDGFAPSGSIADRQLPRLIYPIA